MKASTSDADQALAGTLMRLAFIGEVNVSLHGILSVGAKTKPKASTVIRAMDAIERASRWRPLAVFFDEFQEIVENLDEPESRHLLGVLRAEIQRHTRVAYLFAGSARVRCSSSLPRSAVIFTNPRRFSMWGRSPKWTWRDSSRSNLHAVNANRPRTPCRRFLPWPESRRMTSSSLAYHLWTQSTPGRLGQEELKRAFSALLAEVSRRGELILESATPAQRRVLFATAIREDEETSTDSFHSLRGLQKTTARWARRCAPF